MKMNTVMQRTAMRLGGAGFVRLPSTSHPELTSPEKIKPIINPLMGSTLREYVGALRISSKGEARIYGRSKPSVTTPISGGGWTSSRGEVQYAVLELDGDGAEVDWYRLPQGHDGYDMSCIYFLGDGNLKYPFQQSKESALFRRLQ